MTLKTKNAPFIIGTVILLYVGFALANDFDWSFAETMDVTENGITLESPVLTLAFHLGTLALTYLLPSHWKHRVIYLRWNHPLPGSQAFSGLSQRDSRISIGDLTAEYGELPSSPAEQNALWYKIYKNKQDDDVVVNSHGRWLLFRDVFSICFLTTPLALTYTTWHMGVVRGLSFGAILVGVVAILWICARNTGVRFTCNALAR